MFCLNGQYQKAKSDEMVIHPFNFAGSFRGYSGLTKYVAFRFTIWSRKYWESVVMVQHCQPDVTNHPPVYHSQTILIHFLPLSVVWFITLFSLDSAQNITVLNLIPSFVSFKINFPFPVKVYTHLDFSKTIYLLLFLF